jgi:hypothetical protein
VHENEGGPSKRFWVGGVSEEHEREGEGEVKQARHDAHYACTGAEEQVCKQNCHGRLPDVTAVGTLKTGYPHIQALSQGNEQDVYPHAAT